MSIIEFNKNPSNRELYWFGPIWLIFWGLVGVVLYWRFHWDTVAITVWIAAGVVCVAHYAIPPLRRPLYLSWMYAAFPIGWVLSHVLLAVIYYLVVTPIGLAVRLLKGDPMRREFDSNAATYWDARDDAPIDPKRYFRQF